MTIIRCYNGTHGEEGSHEDLNCLKDIQLISLSSDELGIRSLMLLRCVPGALPSGSWGGLGTADCSNRKAAVTS